LRQAACYREEGLDFGVQLALSSAGFQEASSGATTPPSRG
jgi:hypothetical protein